jgi:hypothetical protein
MEPTERKPGSGGRAGLFVGMLLVLCAPLLAGLLKLPELPVQEMRPLAPWPRWEATPLARWPAAAEAWLNDHFPLRSRLVRWHATLRHRWLREPSKLVAVGRDDWLFYLGEKTVEDLAGRDRFTDAELAAWVRAVEGRRAWWRERGADYMIVFAPNKSTIYPEKLPQFLQSRIRPGKLDQLLAYFDTHRCAAAYLDLRVPLRGLKANATAYWPTDSHWSAEGLVASCDAIMNGLRVMGVPQRVRDEASWVRGERLQRDGDCVGLLSMNGRWPLEPVVQLRIVAPPDLRRVATASSALPVWRGVSEWAQPLAFERESGVGRALMLCDSFFRVGGLAGDALAQSPLILNFRRFVSVWPWFGSRNFATHDVLLALAETERPTVVIEQWTERFLRTPPPDHPEFQRARAAAIAAQQAPKAR